MTTKVRVDSETSELVFTMARGESLRGVLRTSTGAPLANRRIEAWNHQDRGAYTVTDQRGRFEFHRLWRDTFSIRASGPYLEGQIVVAQNVPVPGPDLELIARTCRITGVVSNHEGKPIRVTLRYTGYAWDTSPIEVWTDAEGRFDIPDLIQGRWTVTAERFQPRYASGRWDGDAVGDQNVILCLADK